MKNPLVNAHFSKGAASMSQLSADQGSEVAFAGRSNAGKSSAINTITGHKGLARTSKTPGRTQEINTFVLDDQRRIIDLPGFGYARVSNTVKQRWQRLLNRYLEERQSLRGLVFLMDVRHPLGAGDSQFLQWCQQTAMPVHVLLTKCDKLSRGRAAATLQEIEVALQEFGPHVSVQLFSSTKHQGVEQVRALMVDWLGMKDTQKKRPGDKGRKPGA